MCKLESSFNRHLDKNRRIYIHYKNEITFFQGLRFILTNILVVLAQSRLLTLRSGAKQYLINMEKQEASILTTLFWFLLGMILCIMR